MESCVSEDKTLNEYRNLETMLHRELLNSCRKYMNHLGIVSIVGIIDIVKQEAIELEKATKQDIKNEYNNMDNQQL